MMGQVDIKRQVRYKDSIYDILKDVTLGNYNYLIIGKVNDSKFYDIDFVEQKMENDKIRYISPNFNYKFNSNYPELARLQAQSLMSFIVDEIKDSINQQKLISYDDTMNYINEVARVIDTNDNIKVFFANGANYINEEQFDESIKTLISYYESEMKNYNDAEKLPTGEVLVSDETVKEIYDELENTQNFGVSAIYDYGNKKNDADYIVDPTNNLYVEKPIKEEIKLEEEQKGNNDLEQVKNETNDIPTQPIEESGQLSFQERLYLENEKMLQERNSQSDLQTDLGVKTKTLKLNNSRMNNAAYISISALLYLIGSFELFLAIMLIVKY